MGKTKYTDNELGCREFILNETDFKITKETIFEPDPLTQGVWRISNLKNKFVIILYMAEYSVPFWAY